MRKIFLIITISGLVSLSCTSQANSSNANDGFSFEKAIKVKSVQEEYQYIRENCTKCEFKSQALSQKNDKYYDIITVQKPDGTVVKYYFDINSFFKKF